MAGTFDQAALLDAWETALSEPGPLGAPSLLVSLSWVASSDALAGSTTGETDRMLFALREAVFGPALDCVATCQSCGVIREFSATAGDLVAAAPSSVADRVSLLDGVLQCRPVLNSDLRDLLGSAGPVSARRLLQTCLVGESAVLETLADDDCERALGQLAEADPGACVEVALDCECGHRWIDEFDIRAYLLTELTNWAVRALRDVHRLASRYGWSESAILRMSPWRKRIYLDACEGA
jgi:hypothetical protein